MGKWCPVCGRSCEKYIMFQHEWYWRCPSCKIDADNPPKAQLKPPKAYVKAHDDEMTDPAFRGMYSSVILDFQADDCMMNNIMITNDPHTGNPTAEIKIAAQGRVNGIPKVEIFTEIFNVSPGCPGFENELWEELAVRVLHLNFAANVHDVKIEYLKSRLGHNYPNSKMNIS
jgi:hypothetical protein